MMSSPSPQTTYPPTSSIIILFQTYPVPAHPSDELISGQPLSESWGRTITRISIAVCMFLVLASLSHTFIIALQYMATRYLPHAAGPAAQEVRGVIALIVMRSAT